MCLVLAAGLATTVSIASAQESESLSTRSGWEIGGQASTYRYEEPNLMRLDGERLGLTGGYTATGKHRVHTRFEGRISYGLLDYEGSGTINDVDDFIAEARVVVGRDYPLGGKFVVAPYLGLGYRYLYNDLRGYTNTGAIGYRRYSHYVYAPLGVVGRYGLSERWNLSATVEYDAFLGGRQYSKLTDTNIGYSNASNRQRQGRGYRVSVMAETGSWALGPWLHYWSIKDSLAVPIGGNVIAWEPANNTREYGLEVRYRF
jgi:hypothetical protein